MSLWPFSFSDLTFQAICMAWIGEVESGRTSFSVFSRVLMSEIQMNNVQRRNADVINGDSVIIKRVDIGDTILAQSMVVKCVSDEALMKEAAFRTFCQQVMRKSASSC